MTSAEVPDPRPRSSRWAWVLLGLVFALAGGLRVELLLRPNQALDELTLPDDAYYDAELARNLALGQGPEYRGHAINGFQPLNVLLLAGALRLQPSLLRTDSVAARDRIVKTGLGLAAVFDLLSLLLIVRLFWRRHGLGPGTFFVATLFAAHPLVLSTCFNGLETSLAFTCVLAILLVLTGRNGPDARAADRLLLGVALGVGMLARIDVGFAGLPVLAVLWSQSRGPRRAIRFARACLWVGVGLCAVQLPWLAWSWAWTGRLFPISGTASRIQARQILARNDWDLQWLVGMELAVVVTSAITCMRLVLLALVPATGVFGLARARAWRAGIGRVLREHAFLIAFGLSLFIAYGAYLRAYWFFSRYLFALEVLPFFLLASGIEALPRRKTGSLVATSLAVLGALAICLSHPLLLKLFRQPPTGATGYRALGLWAAQRFPPGTRIGATQTGALSFYAPQLEVVNLDGVVNPDALAAIQTRALTDYMRRERLQYFLGWKVNLDLVARESERFRPADFVWQEEVPALRTWKNPWELWRLD